MQCQSHPSQSGVHKGRGAVQVEVVSGKKGTVEQMQGSRRLRVEFASEEQGFAVLRAVFQLKIYNQKASDLGA